MLWEFDILSSATTHAVPLHMTQRLKMMHRLHNVLPPTDLHQHHATDCNCFNLPRNPVCLTPIHTHRMLEDDEEMRPINISVGIVETPPDLEGF